MREIGAELYAVAAENPGERVGQLKALFAGVQARIAGGIADVADAIHRQAHRANGRKQAGAGGIVLAVLEPTEAHFVQGGGGGDVGPTGAAGAVEHVGVGVVADGGSVGERQLGLNPVGRPEVQIIHAEAERVFVVEVVVELTEQQVGVGFAGHQLGGDSAPQIGYRGVALRGAGGALRHAFGCHRDVIGIGVEQAGRVAEVGRHYGVAAARELAVKEVEQLVLHHWSAQAESRLMAPFGRIHAARR